MPQRFKASLILLVVVGGLLQAQAASPISLPSLVKSLRANSNLQQKSADNSDQSGRDRMDGYSSERQGWKAEFEGERPLRETDGQKIGAGISRRITLGSDQGTREAFRASARAEHFELLARAREEELALARDFVLLVKASRLEEVARESLRTLERHLQFAKKQARLGGVPHLVLRRWELFQRSLQAEGDIAQRQKKLLIDSFIARKLMVLTESSIQVAGIEPPSRFLPVTPQYQSSLTAQASELHREAASKSLESLSAQREFELSVGWSREIESKEDSVKVGLSVPISGGLIQSSHTKDAQALSRAANLRASLEDDIDRRIYLSLKTKLSNAAERILVVQQQVSDVGDLFKDSLRGLERGQTDLMEVIEASREWHDARRSYVDAQFEQDESIVEILASTGAGPFSPEIRK